MIPRPKDTDSDGVADSLDHFPHQAVNCHLDGDKMAEAWEIADVGSLDGPISP